MGEFKVWSLEREVQRPVLLKAPVLSKCFQSTSQVCMTSALLQ